MAKLEILTYPNPLIRKKCGNVENIDDDIVKTSAAMAETMYRAKGVGLAAPQVGILKKIIAVDIGEGLITLINPHITMSEGLIKSEEGCLCLPKLTVDIKRHAKVQVKGYDVNGKELTFDAEDLLARAFQHEIDHLDGLLIIDRLSRLKRDLSIRKYRKLQAAAQDDDEQ
ncbi:MAG: peptide deformylase [Deltaproteobacteria bacterium]|nr:peptide deformylase [Deltaproteobacteria bacterium]